MAACVLDKYNANILDLNINVIAFVVVKITLNRVTCYIAVIYRPQKILHVLISIMN